MRTELSNRSAGQRYQRPCLFRGSGLPAQGHGGAPGYPPRLPHRPQARTAGGAAQIAAGQHRPVDLAQASIGPGMAIYSRYRRVLEADGSPMRVRAALALINQALDEYLAEQEGEYDADTRWALAWFEQFGFEEGAFGDAETLSKAKNTSVQGMVEAGILHARAGKVRLLRRAELAAEWDPASDRRLTVWELAQQLIRAMDERGERAAAGLLAQVGGLAEAARDLAYRLYTLCERKGWAAGGPALQCPRRGLAGAAEAGGGSPAGDGGAARSGRMICHAERVKPPIPLATPTSSYRAFLWIVAATYRVMLNGSNRRSC